ncbi:hypothetical protein HPB47_014486, partial [Ixodes persulcatus]
MTNRSMEIDVVSLALLNARRNIVPCEPSSNESMKLGAANVVILNDLASIKQFYCAEGELSRPRESILYEVTRGTMGTDSVINVSCALLFGTRYALGNPKREHLTKHVTAFVELFHSGTLIESKPHWLSRLEASLPFTRTGSMRRLRNVLLDFIRDRIKEHEDTIEADFNRDYIDGYSKEIEKRQHDSNPAFREEYLLGNTAELLLGSASNSPSLIHWLLLVCAQNPDRIQAKIQKEIDDVVGRQRQPTWEDRKAMPFTMASVIEITRWKVILAIGLPRGVQKDTSIGGYLIPKGTMVLVNVMGVQRNPALWENPDKFDPTRFLAAEGTELSKKPEHHIAFSLGNANICM